MRGAKKAFTLIEVMLAVAVLSLVATASLKLVIMAQAGLRTAKENRAFLAEAEKLRTQVMTGELSESGKDKNLSWETKTGEKNFFTIDFGKVDFDAKKTATAADSAFRWRELEVKDTAKNLKMKIVLPAAKGE